jgi:hypothetical protein
MDLIPRDEIPSGNAAHTRQNRSNPEEKSFSLLLCRISPDIGHIRRENDFPFFYAALSPDMAHI